MFGVRIEVRVVLGDREFALLSALLSNAARITGDIARLDTETTKLSTALKAQGGA